MVAASWRLRGPVRAIVDDVSIAVPPYPDENLVHDGARQGGPG
jgi:hypothetical protein